MEHEGSADHSNRLIEETLLLVGHLGALAALAIREDREVDVI